MRALGREVRGDIAFIVLYLFASLPLQLWALLMGPLPWVNYGHGWSTTLTYGGGAPVAAYLVWRRSPRARLASYVFLALDVMRSVGLHHWFPLGLDLGIILYLQTPLMRRLYPSMWSRRHALSISWVHRKGS